MVQRSEKGSDGGRGVPRGPWHDRVTFAPGGGFAYRPGEVLVREGFAVDAVERLRDMPDARPRIVEEDERRGDTTFARIIGIPDPLEAMDLLRRELGIAAQVNHVLFATACGCPPHPSSSDAAWYYAETAEAERVGARPFYANPFYANAAARGGCCCGGGGMSGNPFYANPFYANPFYANPFYANADPSPFANEACRSTGRRRSSARPAKGPDLQEGEPVEGPVRIAVLDTGWAGDFAPSHGPPGLDAQGHDEPDEAGDGYLDPAAGHGTFIAGVIEQLTPGCDIEVHRVLSTFGDGDEKEITDVLNDLVADPPDIVNLSFGGYSLIGMDCLTDAISALHEAGVAIVASAGNDGTCMPMFPAVLPEVVAVAALDEHEEAAPFTNYGPWVRACTLGADVVSHFFEGFDGDEPPVDGVDPDRFCGWAIWSGTSFAAPRVVAALARAVGAGTDPLDAVAELVDADDLERKPMLGTVVRLD